MQRTPARHPALRAAAAGVVALAAVTAACSTRIASNLTSPSANAGATPIAAKASSEAAAPEAEKPMREFKLDSNARLASDSPRWKIPAGLLESEKKRVVIAQVVIGPDGKADPATFLVAPQNPPADVKVLAAIRDGLPWLRFEPATVRGRQVRQLVTLAFGLNDAGSDVLVTVIPPGPAAPTPPTRRPQAAALPAPDPGKVYFDFQVERPVVMAPGSVGPKYPDDLRTQKVEGSVLAQYTVGVDGRAEMSTFKVLKSSDARFAEAVREALSTMQFSPAEIGGQKVRQLVQQPFQFALPK